LGFGLSIGAILPVYILEAVGVLGPNLLSDWSGQVLGAITTLALPVCLAVAITRYRLFDISVIIRRTVTYALVVALLVLIYFGIVILLQQMFAAVSGEAMSRIMSGIPGVRDIASGQRSEVITVLSTLAIAALFVPLRNRIQDTIDRRFNRKKYDAQKVLNEFATTVRDETDLEKLTGNLMDVVNETMQPESVSVWLRGMEHEGKR